MNLKEAFRYQNKIQALMCDAEEILRNRANITKVTNTNLRHKVMPEASDETVVEIPETEYCGKITDVALFLVFLLEEKSALAAAIRRAKNNLDIDMDSEVALNSARQTVAEIFRTMNGIRSSEQTIANGGTGYRFNTDGNQVTYRCDVRRVTTINYDRNVIRAKSSIAFRFDANALLSLYPTHAAPNIFVFCRFRHRSPGFIRRHSGNIFPTRRKIDHAASDF